MVKEGFLFCTLSLSKASRACKATSSVISYENCPSSPIFVLKNFNRLQDYGWQRIFDLPSFDHLCLQKLQSFARLWLTKDFWLAFVWPSLSSKTSMVCKTMANGGFFVKFTFSLSKASRACKATSSVISYENCPLSPIFVLKNFKRLQDYGWRWVFQCSMTDTPAYEVCLATISPQSPIILMEKW